MSMNLDDRRTVLVGGAAFVACCFGREAVAREGHQAPRSFDLVAFCGLDCSKCDAYLATVRKDDALRAEVAARWNMKPEQIECRGCKSAQALFNCTLKQCATKRGLRTCAHCPDFPACEDEQWIRFPKLREAATALRATLV
jgi:hypothetical protein